MDEPLRRRAAGFDLRLAPDRCEEVLAEVVAGLDDLAARPGVTIAKTNRVRTVLRVPLASGALFVKRYHVSSLFERLKYLVVRSRATTEWRAARAMAAAGLPVPRAVMSGEVRRGPVLADACFATEEIAGARDLVSFAPSLAGDEDRRRALFDDLARLARRLHDAGFSHRDLHGGNLLVTVADGRPEIHLIDLHTVAIRRRIGRGARLRNLAKLLHSLTSVTNSSDRLRMIRAYEGDRPVLGDERTVRATLRARVERLERRREKSRSKRCLRNSSAFVAERLGGYGLYRRREVFAGGVALAVGDHALSVRRRDPEVMKDAARSAISPQVLPGPPATARAVVKETRVRGPLDVLKNALRPPRGRASWRNGNGLIVRRVGVATPYALLERGRWPIRRESWLLMEDLSDATRLDLHVLRRFAGDLSPERRREKLRLVRAFGRFVADLHRRGIYHGDLKAVNVFVRTEGNAPEFRLVDYDRVTFVRAVSRRRRIKNLAQIAASVAVLVTRTDRLRFYRAYAPDEDAVAFEKEYNRGVLRALRKKIVVRMDPIE